MTYYRDTKLDKSGIGDFLRISCREDGHVNFTNAWGGAVYRVTEAEFADRFSEVSDEEVERLFKTYEAIEATVNEGDGSIHGWTNGRLWNGWQEPVFTKETMLEAISEGGYFAGEDFSNLVIFHDADTDDFYLVESTHGQALPQDLDLAEILAVHKSQTLEAADAAFSAKGIYVETIPKIGFKPTGAAEPVAGWAVGNGWCWENMARFTAKAEAAPAVRM